MPKSVTLKRNIEDNTQATKDQTVALTPTQLLRLTLEPDLLSTSESYLKDSSMVSRFLLGIIEKRINK